MPSGFRASTSSAEVSAGTTVTRQASRVKHAQNVVLDAEVVSHYMKIGLGHPGSRLPATRHRHRNSPVVAVPLVGALVLTTFARSRAIHLADAARFRTSLSGSVSIDGDDAAQRAVGAQMANHRAGVDLGDSGNVEAFQIFFRHLLRSASWS